MKRIFLVGIIVALTTVVQAKNLTATFSYCSFDIPGDAPYIETYLSVKGTSVKFVPFEDKLLKGQIEVKWVLRSGDKIIHFDKYNLLSPALAIGDSIVPDFIDLQRIKIENGDYKIELSIRDINTNSKETTLTEDIHIGFPGDTISISDIELVASNNKTTTPGMFSKCGYEIIPFVNVFYPKEFTHLKFYSEIYRTDISPAGDYLVRYFISNNESRRLVENYINSYKQSPKNINVVMGDFDITNLVSGNYNLNIEIRNKNNTIIAFKQVFFQRSNERSKPMVTADISAIDINNTFVSAFINKDSLVDYINCLYPISTGIEIDIEENQMNMADIHSMKQFIYYFWVKRNPENPEAAWIAYKEEVNKTNVSFSTLNKKGYETDRGRVYLQYGPPNVVSDENQDVDAYPYAIWQYYKLNTQSNRKFVFAMKSPATNDYQLIHSNATGEIQNPNWELELHERSQQFGNDVDQEKSIDIYGSRTKENYKDPH